jgi:LysM domain
VVRAALALWFAGVLAGSARAYAGSAPRQSTAVAPGTQADSGVIVYQLRRGEDPSAVAHMFHVTVADLLALNHITDARRLAVGATLKIPDPRATVLAQLRDQKESLAAQLTAARRDAAALQHHGNDLQAQLAALRDADEALRAEHARYRLWQVGVCISAAAVLALGLALLVVWDKAKTEQRRRRLAVKEAAVMHAAVDKYRQLSAQFELRYQSLFHQTAAPEKQARAQTLRQAYEEDRARLDAVVAEAERQIKRAAADLESEPAPAGLGAGLVHLAAPAQKRS